MLCYSIDEALKQGRNRVSTSRPDKQFKQ